MPSQIFISDEAKFDIDLAFYWYESKRTGLGKDFELCLEAGLDSIAAFPYSYQIKYKDLRVCYINHFPYGIHYLIENNHILVFGVFHTNRNPESWTKRIK